MKKEHVLLVLLFLLVLGIRVWITFRAPQFSSDEAYFHLRAIQFLLQEKHFLSFDPLSYGGRAVLYPPVFHLLLSVLSFGNVFLLKLLPELFLSSLIFVVYFLLREMTSYSLGALFGAALSGFVPLFLWETVNSLNSLSLFLPLLFLLFYLYFQLEKPHSRFLFFFVSLLLPFTHPAAILFPLIVLFFLFLLAGGAITPNKIRREALFFSSLLIIFLTLLFYSHAFFTYGFDILRQNAPFNIAADQFRSLTPLELILGVGILPLVLGVLGLYFGIQKEKNEGVYLIGAFGLTSLFLLAFRLIPLAHGLLLLGLSGAVLSGFAIHFFFLQLQKTKFFLLQRFFPMLLILGFTFLSFLPAVQQLNKLQPLPDSVIYDLSSYDTVLPSNAIIAAPLSEGHLVTALAHRKNVLDSNFLLAPQPTERLQDITTLYATWSEAKALEIVHKYGITYIYFSENTARSFSLSELLFAKNSKCFKKGGHLYAVTC
ncbi:hypothetical protein HZB00_00220 [Candidatus Woesearchaeota archaeon]|nr:hypothetical protein [Candidatus Woesearchaeota archaeon]